MTFATAVLEPTSERFMLVEIWPRKYLGVGTSIGSNNYTWTLTVDQVYAVEVNGVTVAGASWSYTGGLLTVNSATNLASVTNFVVIETRVYLTGSKIRDTMAGVSGLQSAIWLPYILSYPQWSQSTRDITAGVFSLSGTSLQVISDERWIQNRLTSSDSWYRAPVYVWLCIDNLETHRLVFNGEVRSLSIKNNIVTFEIADVFQALNQTATFGTQEEAYAIDGGAYSTSVTPQFQNKPIPLIFGKTSPLIVAEGYRISEAFGSPANTKMYHLAEGLTCVPVTANLDTATNVTFLCGRILGTDIKRLTFGTISNVYIHYIDKTVYSGAATHTFTTTMIYLNCSDFNGEIGDYVPGLQGGTFDGFVCKVGTFTHAATTFNVALNVVNYHGTIPGNSGTSASAAPVAMTDGVIPSMSLWIDGTGDASYQVNTSISRIFPTYTGRYVPFTMSLGTSYTFAGETFTHVYASVDYADIGNTDGGAISPNLPGKQPMRCRFSPALTSSHGEVMALLCEGVGLTTNTTSFTDADTDLDVNVVMSSPPFKESEFTSYLDLAQSIATSTLGMLTVNEDREIEYTIIPDPDGETAIGTRNTLNMIDGDSSASVDYQDIYADYIFDNPQYRGTDALNPSGPGPATIVTFNKARYLHKSDRAKTITHVLEDVTNRKEQIAAYLSEPTIEYNFSTAAEDLNSNIGDVVTIENNMIADSTTTKKVMIVAIDATGSKTQIKTNELRGL